MNLYKTKNISNKECDEFKDIDISHASTCPNWLYRGSLLKYLKDIPHEINALIPFNYFSVNKANKIQRSGKLLFQMTFLDETASIVTKTISKELDNVDLESSFDDLRYYILLVSTELVRNGIIQNIKLNQNRKVILNVEESRDDIHISVQDSHGKLKCRDITTRLKNIAEHGKYERKEYGAGLGLFMVINSVNMIEFNVEENKETLIHCTINKYKRLKHFKEKETTIFFEKKDW